MSKQLFMVEAKRQPAARWRQAFPDGEALSRAALLLKAQSDDLLWLDCAHPDWEQVLPVMAARLAVIVVSDQPEDEQAVRSLELGARAYLHARATPARMQEVAEVVAAGGLWVGAELMQRFIAAVRPHLSARPVLALETLSAREHEVARAVAAGCSNKQIAAQLEISERTVKAHLSNIFSKLELDSRVQLALRFPSKMQQADGDEH